MFREVHSVHIITHARILCATLCHTACVAIPLSRVYTYYTQYYSASVCVFIAKALKTQSRYIITLIIISAHGNPILLYAPAEDLPVYGFDSPKKIAQNPPLTVLRD